MAKVLEPDSRTPAAGAGRSGRYRLLLADDSEAIRVLLRVLISLDRELLLVGEAADGVEAVELAESVEADVLVLDIAMPHMDGLEVIERLRSTRPRLRIVVYSGFTDSGFDQRSRALGAADYVVKGVPPDELIARIRAVCRAEADA